MKKINNKGYMLVEVILAFSITFILIYFIMDLVIKSKNKNDDLMVETLVRTDQTIITNKLMSYAISETDGFNCNNIVISKNEDTGESIVKYTDNNNDTKIIDIVSKYAKIDVSNVSCSTNLGKVSIRIPIKVDQMKEVDFDVIIDYKYAIGDIIAPTCSLSVSGTIITATYEDNLGDNNILYYGWNESKAGENNMKISGVGTYTFYVVDKAKNEGNCSVEVVSTQSVLNCGGNSKDSGGCYKTYNPSPYYRCYWLCNGTSIMTEGVGACPYPGNSYCSQSSSSQIGWRCPDGGKYINSSTCKLYVNGTTEYYCDTANGYKKINNSFCYK